MKSALTVTVRNIDSTFQWWCNYHLQRFDFIVVWLDDPGQWSKVDSLKSDRVAVYAGNQIEGESRDGWQERTMLRQDRNIESAIHWCRDRSIDWLCHLDSDELIWATRFQLECVWDTEYNHVFFPNHEVFPIWESANPFEECTAFKLNGEYPFNFYRNGKAAVRIRGDVKAGGPHRFGVDGVEAVRIDSIAVLHYACATFDLWLNKYLVLGNFSNYWLNDIKYPIRLPFHLKSRDLVIECVREQSLEKALVAWSKEVVPQRLLMNLVACGKASIFNAKISASLSVRRP